MIQEGISILLPTKRDYNLDRFYNSILNTVSNINNIEICFLSIEGDIEVLNKINSLKLENKLLINNIISIPIPFNKLWNVAYTISTKNILMLGGDDMEFITPNWDLRFIEEFDKFQDHVALIWGKDRIQNGRLPVHPCVHRKWIETLGYFTPEKFAYWYADNWLDEISKEISFKLGDKHGDNNLQRRIFLEDVFIEHHHYSCGASDHDNVYKENESKLTYNEHLKWHSPTNHKEIMIEVEKLLQVINE